MTNKIKMSNIKNSPDSSARAFQYIHKLENIVEAKTEFDLLTRQILLYLLEDKIFRDMEKDL